MIRLKRMATSAALLVLPVVPAAAVAQSSGAIVQPLPPQSAEDLQIALRRLANNPRDVDALIDAGEAANKLGDVEAAIGFFGRAESLSPNNGRIALGKANSFVLSRRPIEALRLFAEAERLGIGNAQMAAERGLAFDLVGDNASAQALYRLALAQRGSSEIAQRLALSQAIAGDRKGFEATLLPLLSAGDLSAYRTRAFGLAILGEASEAVEIAQARMRPEMAARIAPYLRYMPRLTKAQQAAAGILGIFPRAASIGRDDPAVAAYARSNAANAQGAGANLAPSGVPLGNTATRVASATPPTARPDPRSGETRRRPDRTGSRSERPAAGGELEVTYVPFEEAKQTEATSSPLPSAAAGPAPAQPRVELPPVSLPASPAVVIARQQPAATQAVPSVQEETISLADAFAAFDLGPGDSGPTVAGAVDITKIEIPREKPAPPPEPVEAKVPARHWVQVATGRDRSALKWDWRRIVKEADGKLDDMGPWVTPWVEANRLLAGPYDSGDDAREMVNQLKAMGIDSFPFSSAEGEEIERLD